MARVAAIAPDLMFGSRIVEILGSAGHEVRLSGELVAAEVEGAELIVADLDAEPPEPLVATGLPVLGVYSHTDAETRRAAEAAGIGVVVPRSRAVREMPELAERLLGR